MAAERKRSDVQNVQDNLRRGTIEIVILSMLELGEQYGYQLSKGIRDLSRNRYAIAEATLYPTLYRLENNGFVEGMKKKVVGGRFRVYYHLTSQGKEYLDTAKRQFYDFRETMDSFLSSIEERKES